MLSIFISHILIKHYMYSEYAYSNKPGWVEILDSNFDIQVSESMLCSTKCKSQEYTPRGYACNVENMSTWGHELHHYLRDQSSLQNIEYHALGHAQNLHSSDTKKPKKSETTPNSTPPSPIAIPTRNSSTAQRACLHFETKSSALCAPSPLGPGMASWPHCAPCQPTA